jgi:hypothetical protein
LVGASAEWLVLHAASEDWFLNGYCAVRVADVRRVRRWGGRRGYPGRALAYFGEDEPEPLPHLTLESTPSLITSAAEAFQLLSVYVENKRPQVCHVGVPWRITRRTLRLQEITPEAVWEDRPTTWRLTDITRIDFGRRYEAALAAVGGNAPGTR